MIEVTILLVKPDAVKKELVDSIIKILDKFNLSVLLRRQINLSSHQVRVLYRVHSKEPFFDYLINFMTSGLCEILIVSGKNTIERVNQICGHNNPRLASTETLRNLFGTGKTRNAVHSSTNKECFYSELELFFGTRDINKLIS